MVAPLRRVFSKHIHSLYSFTKPVAVTSALPLCVRCYKPLYAARAFNKNLEQKICSLKDEIGVKAAVTFAITRHVSNNKQEFRNKCYHQHLLKSTPTALDCLSSRRTFILGPSYVHFPQTPILRRDHFNSISIQTKTLKSDVSCRCVQNSSEKKSDEPLVLSQKENIYTIPNLLTLGRMMSSPFLGFMVMHESFVSALVLFTFAGISDLLDGYIARNFKNQNSILGSALDPMADKILISVLMLTLTAVNLIPVPLTALIVGRDIGLVAAAFYLRYISLTPPKTLSRYFDVTLVSAKLEPFTISKWNTAFQLSLVALTLAAPVFNFVDHPFLQGLWYMTGVTTFISGLQYLIYWKDSVKILRPGNKT